uniref:TetR family transcriptional regulator n=1 Tax=Streptomyces sp. NBC_01401 TaxID=2903854 RepID=A0AAU3H4Y8_9ACTN
MTNDGVVVDEAIRAAWDSYRVLEKRTPTEERQQAQERVQAAMDAYGRDEVSRGTVFLVGVLTGYLIAEQAAGEDRLDPLSDLIPAVIRRLPAFEMADPAQVPMVTGVLMAAAMGMDTVAWRDQFGQIPKEEALVHSFVLWLLADLFDSMTDQPGTIDRLMRETFDSMAAEGSGSGS